MHDVCKELEHYKDVTFAQTYSSVEGLETPHK